MPSPSCALPKTVAKRDRHREREIASEFQLLAVPLQIKISADLKDDDKYFKAQDIFIRVVNENTFRFEFHLQENRFLGK